MRRLGVGAQAAALALGTATGQGTQAVLYALAARFAGPEAFGSVVSAYALAIVIAGVVDFGTSNLWVRDYLTHRMTPPDVIRATAGKVLIGAASAAVWTVIALAGAMPQDYSYTGVLLIAIIMSQSAQIAPRLRLRSDRLAVAIVVDRLTGLAFFLVLCAMAVPPALAFVGGLCAGMAVGAICCVGIRFVPRVFSAGRPQFPYRRSLSYGTAAVATSAQSLDLVIIGAQAGIGASGLFGAVNRWTQPLGVLVSGFSQAATPFVARDESWSTSWLSLRRALWMPAVAIVGALAMAFMAPVIVPFILGEAYVGSAGILAVLALAVVPAVIAQPAALFLQARGAERAVGTCIAVCVAVQLSALVPVSGWFGAFGAAVVIAAGQLVMALSLCTIALWRWKRK